MKPLLSHQLGLGHKMNPPLYRMKAGGGVCVVVWQVIIQIENESHNVTETEALINETVIVQI